MGHLIDFLLSVGGSVVAAEVLAFGPSLARNLTYFAVRRLPAEVQERSREEWIADLNDTPGTLGKLWWVGGCFWTVAIANAQAWQQRWEVARQLRQERQEREWEELWADFEALDVTIKRLERLRVRATRLRVRATKRAERANIGLLHTLPWIISVRAARLVHSAAGTLHAQQARLTKRKRGGKD